MIIAEIQSKFQEQFSLIHIINQDDEILQKSDQADWYQLLNEFSWRDHREIAAEYYDALHQFNTMEAEKRIKKTSEIDDGLFETKEEAVQRHLHNRPTLNNDKDKEILYEGKYNQILNSFTDPKIISPNVVPDRFSGRKPKCFFAMLKSFLGTVLMGFPPEPEKVHLLLTSNISFSRVCGFIPKLEMEKYNHRHTPSLRKLEQFDQIMRDWGLWNKIKLNVISSNFEKGIIKKENELVGDTTHYYAHSSFETVLYVDDKGKVRKKSQSIVTKNCHCEDWATCAHSWELADDGAGTIVKSNHKMYWGHKAGIIGFPGQEIPIDAVAILDGATFDGETFYPHVLKVFKEYPIIESWIDRVLYDSACDSEKLKDLFFKNLKIELKASQNPRRNKTITEDLPRGVNKITPYGTVICTGEYELEYKGVRTENVKFIYQAPCDENGSPVCLNCEHKNICCPNSNSGRIINISHDLMSHIDFNDPPMAKRFKNIMKRRPSVERMIKRLKCDLSDDRLSKRGNAAFQAYLDKTMIAFHLLLRK